eukprot:12912409-Prorocentrum_lima.AAC.1
MRVAQVYRDAHAVQEIATNSFCIVGRKNGLQGSGNIFWRPYKQPHARATKLLSSPQGNRGFSIGL